jgi:uncharacterized protein YjbI with pentapeptide repeats
MGEAVRAIDRDDLRADCARCVALCCVAPAFTASGDFAFDKPAGVPCRHLEGVRCSIHGALRGRGFPGCDVYDCFGAGQLLTRTVGGLDWRAAPAAAPLMFRAFAVVRALQELAWHVVAARALGVTTLDAALEAAERRIEHLAGLDVPALLDVDVAAHREGVNALLREVSEQARARGGPLGADRRGADLAGADLRRSDLRRASLRGALLVGADLRGVDLALTDVTGADLRGARLHRADLTRALFLTPAQARSAAGDAATALPAGYARPAHWSAGPRPAPLPGSLAQG